MKKRTTKQQEIYDQLLEEKKSSKEKIEVDIQKIDPEIVKKDDIFDPTDIFNGEKIEETQEVDLVDDNIQEVVYIEKNPKINYVYTEKVYEQEKEKIVSLNLDEKLEVMQITQDKVKEQEELKKIKKRKTAPITNKYYSHEELHKNVHPFKGVELEVKKKGENKKSFLDILIFLFLIVLIGLIIYLLIKK